MFKLAEKIEDLCVILDVVLTMVAVAFTKLGMEEYSKICFGLSGTFLIVALIALIVKKIKK